MTENKEITTIEENNVVALTAPTPMDMIQMAIEKGTSPEQLSHLMDLQDRWEEKQAKKNFVLALAAFRKDCPDISKDAEAHTSKYATLSHILDTIKSTMGKCGLTHSWRTQTEGKEEKKEVTVTCIITHMDGHSEQSSLTAGLDLGKGRNATQAMGSTVSYLERYTLNSVLGITTREIDDDGYGPNQTIDDDQKAELIELIKETDTETDKFIKFMNVSSVDDIPLLKFNKAKNALKAKVKK